MKKLLTLLLVLAATMSSAQEKIYINDASTLREITEIHINDASTLREITEVYINDGGVLRQVFQKVELDGGPGGFYSDTGGEPYSVTVGIRFLTDGTVDIQEGTGEAWIETGYWINNGGSITGNEEVRCTNIITTIGAGDWTTEAAAEDAWVALTSVRTWIANKTSPGDRAFTFTFEVRDTVTPRDTGTSNYTITLDNIT